jgi:hypothetical protein
MKRYTFDENGSLSDDSPLKQVDGKYTSSSLKEATRNLCLGAEYEERATDAIIRVTENVGTSMYLANAAEELDWLRRSSYKTEQRGPVRFFYIKIHKDQ